MLILFNWQKKSSKVYVGYVFYTIAWHFQAKKILKENNSVLFI